MSAFLLQGGDLDISKGRLQIVSDGLEIAQKVGIRLQFFRGEWSLDTSVGIPYFQSLLGPKNPSLSTVRTLLLEAVTSCPGVASVANFTLALDTPTRTLSVSFQATTDTSKPLDFSRIFVVPTQQRQSS